MKFQKCKICGKKNAFKRKITTYIICSNCLTKTIIDADFLQQMKNRKIKEIKVKNFTKRHKEIPTTSL